MAKTSIHITPAKSGCEQHNRRLRELSYVRHDLSALNKGWRADGFTSFDVLLAQIKEDYHAAHGKKLHKAASPIREGVVVIQNSTTMQELQSACDEMERRWGIKTLEIDTHLDEGHWGRLEDGQRAEEYEDSRIRPDGELEYWKPNRHAHIIFDYYDHSTHTSIKLPKSAIYELQTIFARSLGMERGESSDKEHLNAIQYKVQKAEEQLATLNTQVESLERDREKLIREKEEYSRRIEREKARAAEAHRQAQEAAKVVAESYQEARQNSKKGGLFGHSNANAERISELKEKVQKLENNYTEGWILAIDEARKAAESQSGSRNWDWVNTREAARDIGRKLAEEHKNACEAKALLKQVQYCNNELQTKVDGRKLKEYENKITDLSDRLNIMNQKAETLCDELDEHKRKSNAETEKYNLLLKFCDLCGVQIQKSFDRFYQGIQILRSFIMNGLAHLNDSLRSRLKSIMHDLSNSDNPEKQARVGRIMLSEANGDSSWTEEDKARARLEVEDVAGTLFFRGVEMLKNYAASYHVHMDSDEIAEFRSIIRKLSDGSEEKANEVASEMFHVAEETSHWDERARNWTMMEVGDLTRPNVSIGLRR